jgi:pyruvate formate lyase activating enzyme
LNDDKKSAKEMFNWIATELGKDTVLHLSRYYPSYNLNKPATLNDTLYDFYELATEFLNYVYLGNIPNSPLGHNTICKGCSKNLVVRNGYHVSIQGIDNDGKCSNCASDSFIVIN